MNEEPRGIRNCNPGNIRVGQPWQGLCGIQSDGEFAQFVSMQYGVRAMAKILMTYQEKYGLRTVRSMIGRWAPPSENDTAAYVSSVAKAMGVDPDATLTLDAPTLAAMIRGIAAQENGAAVNAALSDADVAAGVAMALGS